MEHSVTVDPVDDDGLVFYSIKITSDAFEVNILVPIEETERLKLVRKTPWASGALRIGTSAGAPAWWCVGDEAEDVETMSILVGHDDQTWDIALELPIDVIDMVLREVEACSAEGEGK